MLAGEEKMLPAEKAKEKRATRLRRAGFPYIISWKVANLCINNFLLSASMLLLFVIDDTNMRRVYSRAKYIIMNLLKKIIDLWKIGLRLFGSKQRFCIPERQIIGLESKILLLKKNIQK